MKKRHIAGWIFILLFASGVFFAGWTQWRVEPGKVGIVMSKTSGIKRECVLPGVFSWAWEFLLPTNARLVIFSTGERTVLRSVTGALPDAALYSAAEDGARYDFSYDVQMEFTALVKAPDVLNLCVNGAITDEASLADYIEKKAQVLAEKTASTLMAQNDSIYRLDEGHFPNLGDAVSKDQAWANGATGVFDGIDFVAVRLVSVHLPDMNLYRSVKDRYFSELQAKKERKDAMQKAVQGLLQQYPELASSTAGAALLAANVPMTDEKPFTGYGTKEDKVENKDGMPKILRAIRGATGVEADTPEAIQKCVLDMCSSLFKQNALTTNDVVSVVFTVTSDLHSMNPATSLRRIAANGMVEGVNVEAVPLFCAQEPQVDGMMAKVIRVMVTAYMEEKTAVSTVYINGTQKLRG